MCNVDQYKTYHANIKTQNYGKGDKHREKEKYEISREPLFKKMKGEHNRTEHRIIHLIVFRQEKCNIH